MNVQPSSEALHDGYPSVLQARRLPFPDALLLEERRLTFPDASSRPGRRICGWCEEAIPREHRADSRYCSTRCRQAAHRFQRGRALRVCCGRPLRLAYADPPYPGLARYYRGHPDYAGEVDHAELVARLVADFPDGWALSTSAEALPAILPSCPPAARVAAWFRGERPTPSYRPLSAWEPVIYCGGRAYPSSAAARRLDALVHVARPRTTDPRRVVGAKPAAFAWWLFDLLGALPGDELVDLYPGSGGIARAWSLYASPVDARRDVAGVFASLRPREMPQEPRSEAAEA